MVFRFLTVLMMVVFTYAIIVQFNDSDPLFWVALYGISLVTSVAAFVSLSMRGMLWIAFGIYFAAVLWMSPNFTHTSMEAFASVGMNSERDELVRELWGMVICTLWTLVLLIYDRKRFPAYSQDASELSGEADEIVCN